MEKERLDNGYVTTTVSEVYKRLGERKFGSFLGMLDMAIDNGYRLRNRLRLFTELNGVYDIDYKEMVEVFKFKLWMRGY